MILPASLLLVLAVSSAPCDSAFDWGWEPTPPGGIAVIEQHYLGAIQREQSRSVHSRLISAYRDHVSPVQGPRCPFLPSCSVFTLHAMNRYGVVIGFLMGMDRLYYRENMALRLHYVPVVDSKGDTKVYDPPEADNPFAAQDWRVVHPAYDLERIVRARSSSGNGDDGRSAAPRRPAP